MGTRQVVVHSFIENCTDEKVVCIAQPSAVRSCGWHS